MKPARIQRRRVKGWKMPPNSVSVTRPGEGSNPFRVGGYYCINVGAFSYLEALTDEAKRDPKFKKIETAQEAVDYFRRYVVGRERYYARFRGQNLACWCRLCERHKDGKPLGENCPECSPCHVDVVLEIANPEDRK